MNIYNYTFYWIYKSVEKHRAYPKIVATGFFSMLTALNLLSLVLYYDLGSFLSRELLFFGIVVSIYLLNVKYFNDKKSSKIIKEYDALKVNSILKFLLFIYPALTIAGFLISLEADTMTIVFAVAIFVIIETIILITD